MPAIMFDSVNPSAIPKDATMLAGYTGGEWPTYHPFVQAFPKATVISVAVQSLSDAEVLDVEYGDATPADVPGWLFRQRARGKNPVVYCSVATWPAVVAACEAKNIKSPLWWSADWTNHAHLTPGAIATQWADGTARYPGLALGCDTSYVSDLAPWVKPVKHGVVVTVVKKVIKAITPPKRMPPLVDGSSNRPLVIELQNLLKINVDGDFGPETKTAVEAFQKAHHLKVDGIVGPQTWKALGK